MSESPGPPRVWVDAALPHDRGDHPAEGDEPAVLPIGELALAGRVRVVDGKEGSMPGDERLVQVLGEVQGVRSCSGTHVLDVDHDSSAQQPIDQAPSDLGESHAVDSAAAVGVAVGESTIVFKG